MKGRGTRAALGVPLRGWPFLLCFVIDFICDRGLAPCEWGCTEYMGALTDSYVAGPM